MDDDLQQEKEMVVEAGKLVSQSCYVGPAGYLIVDNVYFIAFFNDMQKMENTLNEEAKRIGTIRTFTVGEYLFGGVMVSWSSR